MTDTDTGIIATGSDDHVRNLLAMASIRAEGAPATISLNVAEWPRVHRHYNPVETCEHGERLHVGWLELGQEAEYAQQILDFAGVPDGEPQGKGDLDWRVAVAAIRLLEAESRLATIADAHARETAGGGMVGDYCVECGCRHPCPTYRWASGDTDTRDAWDGDRDGET